VATILVIIEQSFFREVKKTQKNDYYHHRLIFSSKFDYFFKMAAVVRQSVVPNFLKATGVRNVYRSSAPDNLADYVGSSRRHLLESERFILYDATLLIDLRSLSEVKRHALIQGAPGGQFKEINGLESMMRSSHAGRQLLSLTDCALTVSDFEKYVSKNWISPGELEKTRESIC
jgi:hypothetical protein